MDLIYFLITAAVFSALSPARWRWWAQPAKAASSAHSFARKVDLGLADHTAEVVTARMVRRERAAIVAGGLGALGAAALAALTTEEAVVSLVLGPERHVRRRLWPTPPGAPVVSRPPLPTWGSAR
jgi:hypothetical protein